MRDGQSHEKQFREFLTIVNGILCTRLIYLRLKTTDFWATMVVQVKALIGHKLRGSIHTQLATRNVNLTFVGVWVIFFDILPVAK